VLNYTHLDGAMMDSAELQGASLKGAHLYGASLYDAKLQGALMDDAQLQGAYMDSARFDGASLQHVFVWRTAVEREYQADALSRRRWSRYSPAGRTPVRTGGLRLESGKVHSTESADHRGRAGRRESRSSAPAHRGPRPRDAHPERGVLAKFWIEQAQSGLRPRTTTRIFSTFCKRWDAAKPAPHCDPGIASYFRRTLQAGDLQLRSLGSCIS
jgi:hypothetical protein